MASDAEQLETNDGGDESELNAAIAAVAAAKAKQPPTRCQGEEFDVGIVTAQEGEEVNLRLVLCKTSFRIRIFLDSKLVFDKDGVKDQLDHSLGPLSRGFHSLTWSYLPNNDPWGTRSEVQVEGHARFALNKSDKSNFPSNNLAVMVRVV